MGDVVSIVPETQVRTVVDHLFRNQAGQMVSTLTRVFGSQHLELAEAVVQEALIQAMQTWPFKGVPDNPAGWIVQVAKNKALDHIRHDRFLIDKEEEVRVAFDHLSSAGVQASSFSIEDAVERHFDRVLRDDQLRMMFVCCHPVLSRESRLALTLKTLCGFGVTEIARAFLTPVETIEQRLVRAKRKIRDERVPFEIPEPRELAGRLDSVLEAIYLLFNEGYAASEGDRLIRRDLCEQAIRLAGLLASSGPGGTHPKTHALLALLQLQASRLDARLDAQGDILLLEEQDRSRWNHRLIRLGLESLDRSAEGDELTDYHLQASIAARHAVAPSFEQTDWAGILSDYDELLLRNHTPVVALNRAVALMMVEGAEAAITEVEAIRNLPPMHRYYLLPATLAEMYRRAGRMEDALREYQQALTLVATRPERRFLEGKMRSLSS